MNHSNEDIARQLRLGLWFDTQAVAETGFGTLDRALWKPLLSAEGAGDPALAMEKLGLLARGATGAVGRPP